jgi:hypothetical protein
MRPPPRSSTLDTLSHDVRNPGRPFSAKTSIDQITSSAVTGAPSENRASGRSRNSTQSRAGLVSTVDASRPYRVNGSSQLRPSRLSYIKDRTAHGARPFTIQGLSESYPPTSPRVSRPPLGASGSAYGRCAKPSGSAGAPCIAIACIGSARATGACAPQISATAIAKGTSFGALANTRHHPCRHRRGEKAGPAVPDGTSAPVGDLRGKRIACESMAVLSILLSLLDRFLACMKPASTTSTPSFVRAFFLCYAAPGPLVIAWAALYVFFLQRP